MGYSHVCMNNRKSHCSAQFFGKFETVTPMNCQNEGLQIDVEFFNSFTQPYLLLFGRHSIKENATIKVAFRRFFSDPLEDRG